MHRHTDKLSHRDRAGWSKKGKRTKVHNEDVYRRLLPSEILDLRSSRADDTSGRASERRGRAREEAEESLPLGEESLPERYPGSCKAGAATRVSTPTRCSRCLSRVVRGFCAVVAALSLAGQDHAE